MRESRTLGSVRAKAEWLSYSTIPLGPVANTDTKLLIYGLFQKGRVLAQDGVARIRSPLVTVGESNAQFGRNLRA